MFEFSKKKTIIGLCGLVVSIGLIILFMQLSPGGNIVDLSISGIVFRVLSLMFLCPSIIHKIDVAYDFAPPQEIYCEIVDAITSIDDDQTTYYLTICYNNEKIKAEVGEQVYKEYEVGDQISVLIKKGALGIEKFILNG